MRSSRVLLPMLVGLVLVTACQHDAVPASGPGEGFLDTSSAPSPPPPPSSTAAPTTSSAAFSGRVVVLDPGHNGGNARAAKAIGTPVPDGRGGTKACNTTGTATNAGYPEHAFNWEVAQLVGAVLSDRGIRVVFTRTDDTGVGPCVDERAAIGNRENAAAVVSIHADGSTAKGAHGFHVSYAAPALNPAQEQPSISLAETLRDRLGAAGFATSTYLGRGGIAPRADLAGLNLSERPAALIECGNMRDSTDAALMSTSDGRRRYADAIADGILTYLSRN